MSQLQGLLYACSVRSTPEYAVPHESYTPVRACNRSPKNRSDSSWSDFILGRVIPRISKKIDPGLWSALFSLRTSNVNDMVHREAIKQCLSGVWLMTSSSHKFEKPRGLPITAPIDCRWSCRNNPELMY